MGTSIFGFLTLIAVFIFCLGDKSEVQSLGFFDLHAAVVVFGGVLGALLIALNKDTLKLMFSSLLKHFIGIKKASDETQSIKNEIEKIKTACRDGNRAVLLNYVDQSTSLEIKYATQIILGQIQGPSAIEKFAEIRQLYLSKYEPVIEGWDLISRLAPSFGMVGTVTGMVQLFKNMSTSTDNLGGSMGMALLATLYGIALGTALGGPMSTRSSNELNDKLNLVDYIEAISSSLVQEFKLHNGNK